MGQCKECRFYNGSDCAKTESKQDAASSCRDFVNFNESPAKKICRTCRLYNGRQCSSDGAKRTAGSCCGKWTTFY